MFLLLFAACHGSDPATSSGSAGSAPTTPSAKPAATGSAGSGDGSAAAAVGSATGSAAGSAATPVAEKPAPPPVSPVPAGGHDFTVEAKALLAVGACGEGSTPEGVTAEQVTKHCDDVKKAQADYTDAWVKPAREFFAAHVPKDIPKKVVYPFSGGDLSTALTVYPDADEITNMSLEPAGDPRDIDTLRGKELDKALATVAFELKFLYRVNFSNTKNMIDASQQIRAHPE